MFYEIRVPKTQERDQHASIGLVQALIDTFGDPDFGEVLFLIRSGEGQGAEYVIKLPPRRVNPADPKSSYDSVPVSEVATVVNRYFPAAVVTDSYEGSELVAGSVGRWQRFVRTRHPFGVYNPTLTYDRMHRDDPFALLAQLLFQTPPEDYAYYGVQVLSGRRSDFVTGAGKSILMKALGGALTPNNPLAQRDFNRRIDNIREAQQYKAAEGAYAVLPYVCYRTLNKNRLQTAESVARVVTHCGIEGVPFAEGFVSTDRAIRDDDDFHNEPMYFFEFNDYAARHKGTRYKDEDDVFLMTPHELASLWHLPDKTYPIEAVHWLEVRVCREIPDELKRVADGQYVGTSVGCDESQTRYPVRLPRQRDVWHTLILGKVGMGKTTLMHRMIHEDIAVGRTVVVVDPKGSQPTGLINRILQQSIPDNRIDDVVLVDLTAIEGNPPPINPLMGVRGDSVRFGNASRNRVTADFVATLTRLYGDTDFRGTRMEDWLRLALKTIAIDENATLSDVRRVLRNPTYRKSLIEQSEQLPLLEDWEEFDKADRAEGTINGVLTRIRRFMQSNETLSLVCHPNPVHYGELAAQGKIILVSAGGQPAVLSEEERITLASIIVTQVMDGAQSGLYSQQVSMYIDEAGQFLNAPIPKMLRLVRSGNLALTLASQGMSALSSEMQDAVDETVATIIGFAMSEADAKMLKPFVADVYTSDELQTLPQFVAATSIRYNGTYLRAFELHIERSTANTSVSDRAQLVRRRSIEKYMPMSYGEVLDAYKQRYANNSRPSDDEPSDDDFIKRPPKA